VRFCLTAERGREYARPAVSTRPFVVAALLVTALAAPARAQVDKCELLIGKNAAKVEGKLLTGFQKCADFYRKATVKGTPLADAAAACQIQLDKTLLFPDPSGKSVLAAGKAALDLLTSSGLCTDDDLRTLGHLPTATFNDTWSRAIVVAKLGAAYTTQITLTRDTPSIFRALAAQGTCPSCAGLVAPPCSTHTCRLSAGTSNVEIRIGAGAPLASPTLSGQLTVDLCRDDAVLPGDYVITGSPSKTLREANVLGATACVTVGTPHGYITCGASAPRIAMSTCQDHAVGPTPETDDCAAAGFTTCGPTTQDLIDGDPSGASNSHIGALNGGLCLNVATSPAAAGDAVLMAPLTLKLVRAAQFGPDGLACTADDTGGTTFSTSLPLTTATAQAQVVSANDAPGSTIASPVMSGTRFSCPNVAGGSLATAKLVGALPTIDGVCASPPCDDPSTPADEGSMPIDATLGFTLTCQ
jgi:hypothetical protein